MKQISVAILLSGLLLTSCFTPPKPPSDNEITRLARQKVIEELRPLDELAIHYIQTNEPVIKWKTIDWYLDYEMSWQLVSNRVVVVSGTWSDRDKLKYSRAHVRHGKQ